jgi:hypothetical protein
MLLALVPLVATADQPAARKPGVLRIELLTLIKRSPMPSLMVERYEERSCQMAKLSTCQPGVMVSGGITRRGE